MTAARSRSPTSFTDSTATGDEGGASLNLTNDTFTRNSAYDGGVIIVYSGTTTLRKTVVFGSRA
jgi:hypothetical protein